MCGESVDLIAGLTCTLCGRPFHFASQLGGRDCGVVAPNPASDGCCGLVYLCAVCASDIYPELLAARGISGRT